MRASSARLIVGAALTIAVLTQLVQAVVLRPHVWPAGAGLALSADTVMGALAAPRPVTVIRPPDLRGTAGTRVIVDRVLAGGAAEHAGIRAGDEIRAVADRTGHRVTLSPGLPADAAGVLHVWRDMQRFRPGSAIEIELADAAGQIRTVSIDQPAVWSVNRETWVAWLRVHLGPLAQVTAFLAGAAALVILGVRGWTGALMTLAMIGTAASNAGPLLGADRAVAFAGPLLLIFNWIVTPLTFPIIGLAVLHFPQRAAILDRRRWIVPAVLAATAPMLAISLTSAAYLSGVDAALPMLVWLTERSWMFEASFALALAVNVLIVIEGIQRYRASLDSDERRRIEIVVFTGVPAVFAYALKTGVPLLAGLAGRPLSLPWIVEAVLLGILLLPAFGLPYAVAVRHVFSPRTVLRRSLQYAFARRTLAVLVMLPVVALVASLIQQRDESLVSIVSGRPLFYLFFVGMLLAAVRYRDAARRWLDRRFFRAEYDAREILVSLAGRVPYEANPRELLRMVVTQIDSALHPECIAVLTASTVTGSGQVPSGSTGFDPVTELRVTAAPLTADSAIITLLRWSDKPLEVFLDDEESPVARVPPADRAWLADANAALLVPIFAGGSEPRPFVGVIALGPKWSEERYTPEDRELLRGIAGQMGVALDLSRLRAQAATPQAARGTQALTPTVIMGGGRSSAIAIGATIDGKYRVDAVIGQGGMGAVYRAWDLRLERPVAIKVVRADLLSDPESHARFRRESQIVARLQHPSIVTVYDYGTVSDGSAFLIMEFVPGEDLRQLLKREAHLPPARASALVTGIAGGVESAHRAGIYHRDLKPENILLPESGTGPKVVDFGVAKLTSPTMTTDGSGVLTAGGTIVGTPAYMSPEQLRGEPIDGRTDVFSLGVMAFEMLTGKLPYGNASFFDIGMRQAAGAASVEMKGIAPELSSVLQKAIAFGKDERYSSALAFAEDLAASART